MVKILDKSLQYIIIALFSSLVLLTLVQVVSRYMGMPLKGTDETVRYLFIWLVFLGIAYGMREKIHISVDFFSEKLGNKARFTITIFNYLLMLFYTGVLIYQGIIVTQTMHLQFAPISRIPMSYIFAAIPIGAALLFFYIVLNMVSSIKKRDEVNKSC